jgi:hypothetical protein
MQKYCPNWAVNHRKLPAKLLKGAIDEVWCFKAILILGIEIYFYLHTYDTYYVSKIVATYFEKKLFL